MLEELKSLYDAYISSVTTQWYSRDFGDVVTAMFSGRGRFGRDDSLVPFLQALDEFVLRCVSQPVDEKTAAELMRYMLFEVHDAPPEPAADGLETADGKALLLAKLISAEDREHIYNMYRQKLRRHPGLPCQRAVLKALKSNGPI